MSCGWLQSCTAVRIANICRSFRKPDRLLDLAFSSDSSMVATVDTLQPVSDHLPILLKTNAFGRPGAEIGMLNRMKDDGTFVMPTWRLCIALFYPWTGRFLTWRRTLMDCGKNGNRRSFDVWNRLFRSGRPVLTSHRPTLGLTLSWLGWFDAGMVYFCVLADQIRKKCRYVIGNPGTW